MRELVTSKIILNDVEFIVNGYVHYNVDKKYGADADGNRGEKRVFVDDVTDIQAFDRMEDDEVYMHPSDKDRIAEELTRKFLEE